MLENVQISTSISAKRFRGPFSLDRFSINSKQSVVHSPLLGKTIIMSKTAVAFLERCQTFATLDQHAISVAEEFNLSGNIDEVKSVFKLLLESGMLITEEYLKENVIGRAIETEPAPLISSLCVPTRNRPELLRRCVTSYGQGIQTYERQIQLLVCDQSDESGVRDENFQTLANLKRDKNVTSFYIGPQEKKAFAALLADYAGVRPEIVNFCILGVDQNFAPYGANRNALLLSTIGETTLQVDDDTLCQAKRASAAGHGLVLTTRWDPTRTQFLSEPKLTSFEQDFALTNVFALHEELLGKSIPTLIEKYGEFNVNDCEINFFRRAEPRCVAVTLLGSAGEFGIGTPYYFMWLNGEARASMIGNEEDYIGAMMNQQGTRAVECATVNDGGFCAALNLGLDNRQLLPPFMPVQRNEDGIFSSLLNVSLNGYFGFLPWLLLHKRETRLSSAQQVKTELQTRCQGMNSGNILSELVRDLTPRPDRSDAVRNLVALGQTLTEWGSCSLSEFEEMVRLMLFKSTSRRIRYLEENLKKYHAEPVYWANDIIMSLEIMRECLPTERFAVPQDLRDMFGEDDARIHFQRLVRKLGELLEVWPDLRQAAHELKARGESFGTRV